jgi:hypothetical protein
MIKNPMQSAPVRHMGIYSRIFQPLLQLDKSYEFPSNLGFLGFNKMKGGGNFTHKTWFYIKNFLPALLETMGFSLETMHSL